MFEIDTGLVFWTALSFSAMLFILYKAVFPPLVRVMDQRRDMIEGGIIKARKAREEAEELLEKYKKQLAEAERKSIEMFSEAQRRSQAIREEAVLGAQKEALRVIEKSKQDIELYRRRAVSELKTEISGLIIEVAGRLMRKKIDAGEHVRLINSSIRELEKNAKRKV